MESLCNKVVNGSKSVHKITITKNNQSKFSETFQGLCVIEIMH